MIYSVPSDVTIRNSGETETGARADILRQPAGGLTADEDCALAHVPKVHSDPSFR